MAYELREGQGSLFKNEKKNERQPDFKGTIMIKGVLYNVSAWSRTSQNGREYISLQAEEKTDDERQQRTYQPRPANRTPAPETAPAPAVEDMPSFGPDDDLPF